MLAQVDPHVDGVVASGQRAVRTSERSNSLDRRLPLLDLLRFFAASAVLLYHFTASTRGREYWGSPSEQVFSAVNDWSRYGWVAVQIFFVISGLVITTSASGRTVGAFCRSRFTRLYPAYWAAVGVTVILHSVWEPARGLSPLQSIANLTMVQGQVGVPNAQVVFWTLLVELKFYVLVAVTMGRGTLTYKKGLSIAYVWPIAGVMLVWLDGHATNATAKLITASLVGAAVPAFAPFFALGIVIALGYARGPSWMVGFGVLINTVLCLQNISAATRETSDILDASLSGTVSQLAFVLVVMVLAASLWVRYRDGRFAYTLGALSYPLYLVHVEFGFFAIDQSVDVWGPAVAVVCASAVSLALAAGIHWGVERPVSALVRSRRRHYNQLPHVQATRPARSE